MGGSIIRGLVPYIPRTDSKRREVRVGIFREVDSVLRDGMLPIAGFGGNELCYGAFFIS
jgi:hypothetical protein